MATKSALILGGGIVGLACALRLQQRGFSCIMVYPNGEGISPSLGNAGHLAVEQIEPLSSMRTLWEAPRRLFAFGGALDLPLREVGTWAQFAARFIAASAPGAFREGKAALEAWLAEAMASWRRLAVDVDAERLLAADGHFVVWESAAAAKRGKAAWGRLTAPAAAFRPAAADELERIQEQVIAHVAGAIRFRQSGQIRDLAAMCDSIARAFDGAGGMRIAARASRLEMENGRAAVRLADGTRRDADLVLVAAGVESGALLGGVGHRIPIIAERGYHIESPTDAWPERFPPAVFEDRSLIVTRFLNSLRVASFAEFSRIDAPPDRRKWRRLRRHAAELGLPLKEPIQEWVGARPTLPDYRPAIGRSSRVENLFYAFGHQHLGLTLAPVTAEVIAQLACDEAPEFEIAPFDLARFERGISTSPRSGSHDKGRRWIDGGRGTRRSETLAE